MDPFARVTAVIAIVLTSINIGVTIFIFRAHGRVKVRAALDGQPYELMVKVWNVGRMVAYIHRVCLEIPIRGGYYRLALDPEDTTKHDTELPPGKSALFSAGVMVPEKTAQLGVAVQEGCHRAFVSVTSADTELFRIKGKVLRSFLRQMFPFLRERKLFGSFFPSLNDEPLRVDLYSWTGGAPSTKGQVVLYGVPLTKPEDFETTPPNVISFENAQIIAAKIAVNHLLGLETVGGFNWELSAESRSTSKYAYKHET